MELDKQVYRMDTDKRKKIKVYLQHYNKFLDQTSMNIFHYSRYMKQRIKQGYDAWVGVSGETGTGKSQFVLMNCALMGRRFNLKDNVAYIPQGNEISDKFDKLNGGELLIDEAGKSMRGVNWHNKDAQGVNVKAMTDRFIGNTVYMNIPDYSEFMGSTKKAFHFRIHLLYRDETGAMVVVHRKIGYGITKEQWAETTSEKNFKDFTYKRRGSMIPNNYEKLALHLRLPTYVMHFKVPALQWIVPEYVKAYEHFKKESRKENPEDEGKEMGSRQQGYIKVIGLALQSEIKAGVPTKEMAKKYGVNIRTMQLWIRKAKQNAQEKALKLTVV